MSQKTAVAITAKDNGLENEAAIQAEIEEIELELEQDRLDQQTLQAEINPENPSTGPLSRQTVTAGVALSDAVEDGKKKDYFPLHGEKAATEEKRFARMLRRHFAKVSKELKKETKGHVQKVSFLKSMLDAEGDETKTPVLVDQYIDLYQEVWDSLQPELTDEYLKFYWKTADTAREKIGEGLEIKLSTDFVNPDMQQYLQENALEQSKIISETNKNLLRKELSEAYTNGEKTAQWQARIDKVLGLNTPSGRSDMIARTELAWGYSRGLIATYKEVGIDRVQWLAVMDNRTCPICAGRNGNTYSLAKVEGMIPSHPRCRCTICSVD
jgi:SPP1 gp7 family putative phage head morphogenesis protein